MRLFRTYENLYRRSAEIPPTAYLVFQETAVRLFHVLGQIGKKHECGYLRTWQLRYIFYFDILAFGCRRWIALDKRQQTFVQLCGRNFTEFVFIDMHGRFQNLENPLLGQCRSKNNRKIHKRRQTLTNRLLKMLDIADLLVLRALIR